MISPNLNGFSVGHVESTFFLVKFKLNGEVSVSNAFDMLKCDLTIRSNVSNKTFVPSNVRTSSS